MAEGNDPSNSNPGGGIDTGTGGFPIGDSNQRLSFDVGTDEDSPLDRSTWTQGDIKVDNTKKDISRSTKSTLAAYLSDTTLGNTPSAPNGSKNKYPIDHAIGNDPAELTLTDKEGYASDPDVALNNYIKDKVYAGQPDDLKSLTSKSDLAKDLKVVKGNQNPSTKKFGTGANATPIDGNVLLKDSTTKDKSGRTVLSDKNPVKQYYSNSITNNRFNPEGNQYADYFFNDTTNANDLDISPDDLQRLRQEQFALKYEKGTSTADRNLSFGKLAQIGVALSTRAGLEFVDDIPDPSGPQASAAALLPGTAQLGVSRVERESLNARRILEEIVGNGESIEENVLINPLGRSWGSLNNPLDEFAGMSSFGMQILAAALVVGLALTIELFNLLLPGGTVVAYDYRTKLENGQLPYGAYKAGTVTDYSNILAVIDSIRSGNFKWYSLIGIKPTDNPLSECIRAGALATVGLSNPPGPGEDPKAKLNVAVVQSPGYYVILARSITRSFLQIGDSFVKLARPFGSGNFTEGIKQTFNLIQTLRDSKFIGVLGVFAALGDRILGLKDSDTNLYRDKNSSGFSVKFKSEIDLADDRAGGKGRRSGKNTTLAWATSTSRSTLIDQYNKGKGTFLSTSVIAGDVVLGIPNFGPQLKTGRQYDQADESSSEGYPIYQPAFDREGKNTGRISAEERAAIEYQLEAEYVPFYFHDVRTNEVLGFHAFLTSLTDDYTVNYDSVDGFGRVEPVKVYKGTTRKISLSFIVASTSLDDFEVMWLKINKLVTMIYPQFTEGRKIISGDYTLHAPFSQSIAASPLIRLRIGDLIKSNYSKFNLARVFGYTHPGVRFAAPPNQSPDVQPPPQGQQTTSPTGTGYKDPTGFDWNGYEKERLKPGNTFRLGNGAKLDMHAQKNDPGAISDFVKKNLKGKTLPGINLPRGYVLKIEETATQTVSSVGYQTDDYYLCRVTRAEGEDLDPTTIALRGQKYHNGFYEGRGGAANNIYDNLYWIHNKDLVPSVSTQNKLSKFGNKPTPAQIAAAAQQRDAQANATAAQSPPTSSSPATQVESVRPQSIENVKSFMNDDEGNSQEGNAVVRSFKSSGGKGLAGFIDSLSFDWYDNVTWETEFDTKIAPKMCKVTISFTPISDITPGLDSRGSNRAPVYPVGPLSPPTLSAPSRLGRNSS